MAGCNDTPFQGKDLEASEQQVQLAFLCGSAAVMLTLYAGSVLHRCEVTWVPESLLAVSVGALVGFALWATPSFAPPGHLPYQAEYFWFAVYLKMFALPLIIFEAGWSLRLRDFFSQLIYILIFAILGTVVSIVIVAGLLLGTSDYHGLKDKQTAWAYASLISSVDPVATLASFGHLNVDRLLFILAFGESQINDAVAITMFDAFNSPSVDDSASSLMMQMLKYLFGSLGLGVAVAMSCVLLLRLSKASRSPHEVIIFLTVCCTFTYQAAEMVELSGIITVLFSSIVLSAYASPHLSAEGVALFSFLLKQASSICDTIIFIVVGLQAVRVGRKDTILSMWLMLFVLVSRAAAIFPLGLLCNGMKAIVGKRLPAEKRHFISWKHMVMLWHGGVGRGGVSLWMATELRQVHGEDGSDFRPRLIAATFNLICCFLILFGATTPCLMRWLDLPMGDDVPPDETLYSKEDKSGLPFRFGQWLHRAVLVPLLVGRVRMQELDGAKREMGGNESLGVRLEDRRPSSRLSFPIFGSDDPGHRDQMQDVVEEEEEEPPSTSSSSESDCG